MSDNRQYISCSAIFEYWKDKAITEDGEVIYEKDFDKTGKDSIPVVIDWGEPECWACRQQINVYKRKSYDSDLLFVLSRIWDYREVSKELNKCHILAKQAGGTEIPQNMFLLCEHCHIESPDTLNPKNFFKWVYKKRKSCQENINGFNFVQLIKDFLQDCKEKSKIPFTLREEKAQILGRCGKASHSTMVMALSDTCDDL